MVIEFLETTFPNYDGEMVLLGIVIVIVAILLCCCGKSKKKSKTQNKTRKNVKPKKSHKSTSKNRIIRGEVRRVR